VLNKEIIGKPKNEKDAFNILSRLARPMQFIPVLLFAMFSYGRKIIDYEKTKVTFPENYYPRIRNYIKTEVRWE